MKTEMPIWKQAVYVCLVVVIAPFVFTASFLRAVHRSHARAKAIKLATAPVTARST